MIANAKGKEGYGDLWEPAQTKENTPLDRSAREKMVGRQVMLVREIVEVFCGKCGNMRDMTLG